MMNDRFRRLKAQLQPAPAVKQDLLDQVALSHKPAWYQYPIYRGVSVVLSMGMVLMLVLNYQTISQWLLYSDGSVANEFNTIRSMKSADVMAVTPEMVDVSAYQLSGLKERFKQSIRQPGIKYQLTNQEIYVTTLKATQQVYAISPLVYRVTQGYHDTQLIINLQVDGVVPDDVYYAGETTLSNINGIDVTFGEVTYEVNQQLLYVYTAEFTDGAIGYRVVGEAMSQSEFLMTIREMLNK
jgi:type II secretory pathway component PulM